MADSNPKKPLQRSNTKKIYQPSKSKKLYQLARDGDVREIREVLRSPEYNVKKEGNSQNAGYLSALLYAAKYDKLPMVKLLVEKGATVNITNEKGITPLHFATYGQEEEDGGEEEEGEEENDKLKDQQGIGHQSNGDQAGLNRTDENSVIKYLIKNGSGVNKQDDNDDTPLHHSIIRGNVVAAEDLLNDDKINVKLQGNYDMTPLHLAIFHGQEKIVEMLIEKSPDLIHNKEACYTYLYLACNSSCLKIVELLLDKMLDPKGVVQLSNKPLLSAVETGNAEIAKHLIDNGADVNKKDENYQSPLHLAARFGYGIILELLVVNSADIDAEDDNQETPLHKAAAFGQKDIVRKLLKMGADLCKNNTEKFSPFLMAAANGHQETLTELIKFGANINDQNNNGENAASLAARKDHSEVLQFLLNVDDNDADKLKFSLNVDTYDADKLMNSWNSDEDTPLHVAAKNGHIKCVKALVNAKAPLDAKNKSKQIPFHCAAEQGKTDVVEFFLTKDRSLVNYEDRDSKTALHYAATEGHHKVAKVLIKAEANVEASSSSVSKLTPLHCAARNGWSKMVKLLLNASAKINKRNEEKETALIIAAKSGQVKCVEILLDKGADVTKEDSFGDNCLDCAILGDHREAAMTIVKSTKWEEALRKASIDWIEDIQTSPLRRLICKFPDVAKVVFDRCVKRDEGDYENVDIKTYKVTFRYEFLEDSYIKPNKANEGANGGQNDVYDEDRLKSGVKPYTDKPLKLINNHPLMIMVRNDQEDLLAHPLVNSLLDHKWNKCGRYAYYFNLVLYFLYVAFLTGYVCFARAPFSYKLYKNEYISNLTKCAEIKDFFENAGDPIEQHIVCAIGKYAIYVLCAICIIREFCQMSLYRKDYLEWENLMEWITYISAILTVTDFNSCQMETGIRESWQWHLAAVSVFLAWIHLVLFVRKLKRFGIYVMMFMDVLKSFLELFPVFFLFVVAFALAFHCLIQNQIAFANPGISLLKTSVMVLGEIEFSDIAFSGSDEEEGTPSFYRKTLYYRPITYFFYALFFVLMSVIIMNLLIGVAVGDIQAVKEQAEMKSMEIRVNLVLNMERLLPEWITRKCIRKTKVTTKNKKNKNKTSIGISKAMKTNSKLENKKEEKSDSKEISKSMKKKNSKLEKKKETDIERLENKLDQNLIEMSKMKKENGESKRKLDQLIIEMSKGKKENGEGTQNKLDQLLIEMSKMRKEIVEGTQSTNQDIGNGSNRSSLTNSNRSSLTSMHE